ncbi:Alpha-L-fucosidase [bacterium A37T11]|nr:Alpha-L-fucosidase [bacterium A37T11]
MHKNNLFGLLVIYLLLFISLQPAIAQRSHVSLTSPDKNITYSLQIVGGQVHYSISRNKQPVLDASAMGMTVNDSEVGKGRSFTEISRTSVQEIYPITGVHSTAHNQYKELIVQVNGDRPFQVNVRVFNDGVAFRYRIPNPGTANIQADQTDFCIPAGSTVWSQPSISYYEGDYQQQHIEDVPKGQLAGPPLTIRLPGKLGYASITEGGLTDFAGMSLRATGSRTFCANLTGLTEKTGTIESPWRVVIIGGDLNTLVNSDIILNVSPKPDPLLFPEGPATEWIKPGKCVWSWLADNGPVSLENMKRFSDWAGELGFPYNLVDEGWSGWQEAGKDKWAMLKDLVDYSSKKGVKIWLWKAYPDRNGVPGLKDSTSRIAFFDKCRELGIAGLKIDFFDAESQEVIQFYQHALKDAAARHLLLDFHGANKPTGETRTWPNELSREAVLGLEYGAKGPKHALTLLFTRFLAGHADFTPLTFNDRAKGTTLTHQVATVAAFTSPFMCLGVDPEHLLTSEVKNMVQNIPIVWDETVILPPSEISSLAIMARRSGKDWYLVALNGENPTSLPIDLKFLGKGTYQGSLLEDAAGNPGQTSQKTGSYTSLSKLSIRMPPGGGFIARFTLDKAGSFASIGLHDTPADILYKADHIVPSPRQLRWQQLELTAFFHFGINTFTDKEWGDGSEDISQFNPAALDARQWVKTMKEAGFKQVILTAKHHDGFCLWPSKYTAHAIQNTPYKNGKGDIVKDVAKACKQENIGFGIYLSPWDRNSNLYGDSVRYNAYFVNQLTELLTQYGRVDEVWFDGANGEGPNGKKQVYGFDAWYKLIRKLQPQAVIAVMGPDVRWVGTESGVGRETEWSVLPVGEQSQQKIAATSQKEMMVVPAVLGDSHDQDLGGRSHIMQAKGLIWYPAETDVSIRPGWFYHRNQDAQVKSPQQLLKTYFTSVGRNGVLLLNVPPDKNGLISDADIKSLQGFSQLMKATFSKNLASDGRMTILSSSDTSTILEIILKGPKTINVLMLQENIAVGQRVESFTVEYFDGSAWKLLTGGTTVGYKRLIQFEPVSTTKFRVHVFARAKPEISKIGLYKLAKE